MARAFSRCIFNNKAFQLELLETASQDFSYYYSSSQLNFGRIPNNFKKKSSKKTFHG
jgi:hypothetical protein